MRTAGDRPVGDATPLCHPAIKEVYACHKSGALRRNAPDSCATNPRVLECGFGSTTLDEAADRLPQGQPGTHT